MDEFFSLKIKAHLFVTALFIFIGFRSFSQTREQRIILAHIKQIQASDTASEYVQKLLVQASKTNDKDFEAELLVVQSFLVYTKGDEHGSLRYARQAMQIVTIADSDTWVKAHTMVAYMLSRGGDNVNALKVAFEALRKTDSKGWRKLGLGCRICVADIYRTIDQPEKAIPYAQQAAAIAYAIKDTSQYIFALSTLSNVYSQHAIANPANIAKATGYMEVILNPPYLKFLSLFEQTRYYSNMGRLYSMNGNYPKAEAALQKAIGLGEQGKFSAIEKHALNEMLTVKNHEHEYADAIKYGKRALTILSPEKSTLIQQRDLYDRLTDAYVGLSDYKHAFDYQQKSKILYDSLMATNRAAAAAELDDKYRADKRLIIQSNQTRLFEQQRNFIMVLALIIVLAIVGVYRWLVYKRKKEAHMLAAEHEQLERMDALKTRFFNNISHELRTPLTLIMGPVEALADNAQLESGVSEGYIQTIRRNSKKLLNMVNELLDLGKIESGNMALKNQPTKLYDFIVMLYQGFASLAEYKKIGYTSHCTIDKSIYAQIDREKMEKVINNLISNAIKFTSSGGAINIKAAQNDGIIYIEVMDTGKGIGPADLPYIFDRYYQSAVTTATPEGGTGIGLAIAKEFTILMGGRIYAESMLDKGTKFKVELPFIAAGATDEKISIGPEKINAVSVFAKDSSKLIMLVEDHPEMIQYVASVLMPDYNIVTASDGNEALALLEKGDVLPDLIVSDVMMPGMDGFTLLNKLKQHDVFCRIPVIMLTALADSRNKLKALHTGVDDYLTKPFLSSELKARVINLLNNVHERKKAIKGVNAKPVEESIQITDIPSGPSPADLHWLTELETLVRKYTGKSDIKLAALSYDMAISERQLFRRIKAITGLTPNMYIRSIRLQVAREAIESGKYRTVAEISYTAGFETPAYFSKLFKEYYGRDVNDLL